MNRGSYAVLATLAVLLAVSVARADVFPVPASIHDMRSPHEEVHVLRTLADGTPLGEQRFEAVVEHDLLALTVVTHFANGEQWDEHAEMDLSAGYRAKEFHKIGRLGSKVIAEQRVDFATGKVSWLRDGQRGECTLALTPDTYIGPMLGVVLADVPDAALGAASLQTIVFRPDPRVYTLRADVVDQENFKVGNVSEPTTKVRLKADLGPVQNLVFASLIPTHYFWFTRESPPEFFAFEGTLGYGGPELRMIPQRSATSTAKAG
ncbi:MAG: hypothetical protein HY271_02905 [Deltaproteobacteria bacterium]|nr:hypothetical protein [Deltaproteobacteria bacterium]